MAGRRTYSIGGGVVVAVAAAAVAAAAWLAPATLADVEVARMTGGRLRLAAAEGTLWRGRAHVVAGTAAMPVAWRLDPWPLLRGEARFRVQPFADGAGRRPRASVAIDGARVSLRDVDVALPAAAIGPALHPGAFPAAAGELAATSSTIEWEPAAVRGAAQLRWRHAQLVSADGVTPIDLGDVSAVLDADGRELAGPVSNEGGDVAVRGRIAVRAGDAIGVAVALTPRAVPGPALARALSAIATADGSAWRIEARITLR